MINELLKRLLLFGKFIMFCRSKLFHVGLGHGGSSFGNLRRGVLHFPLLSRPNHPEESLLRFGNCWHFSVTSITGTRTGASCISHFLSICSCVLLGSNFCNITHCFFVCLSLLFRRHSIVLPGDFHLLING